MKNLNLTKNQQEAMSILNSEYEAYDDCDVQLVTLRQCVEALVNSGWSLPEAKGTVGSLTKTELLFFGEEANGSNNFEEVYGLVDLNK